MHIRTYKPDDLPRLQEITLAAFEGVSIDENIEKRFGKLGQSTWRQRKAEHISDDVKANPKGVFVAEEAAQIVGYLTTRINTQTRVGWIPNLAVDKPHRRKGVARALFHKAFEYFKQNGMLYSRIETLEQNAVGLTFYPSLGYEEVARQVHYFMRLP